MGGRWGAERTLLATEVCTVGQKQFNGRLLHTDHFFILGGPLLNLSVFPTNSNPEWIPGSGTSCSLPNPRQARVAAPPLPPLV